MNRPPQRFRVFRIAEDYPVGGRPSYGLQPVFYYLSKEQAKLGNEVHVIALSKGSEKVNDETDGVIVHRVRPPFNINAALKLKSLLREPLESIIHTHATSGMFTRPLKRPLGCPLVSHVHGTTISRHTPVNIKIDGFELHYSFSKVWYYYFRERYLWSAADRILTVSNLVKADLNKFYSMPLSKIVPVFNGVDTNLFKNVEKEKQHVLPPQVDGKRLILYVGHFGPRKGIPILIRAMKKVSMEVKDAVLVCIGGVPEWLGKSAYWSQLVSFIEKHDLREKVFLLNRVANDDLPGYYSRSSVFVLPSYYETFAKVVIEAMACSTPVIATRGGGVDEIIFNEKTGLLVNYGSSDELAAAIIRLLTDDSLAHQMGEEGRKRVEKNFTWKSVAERINFVYEDLLAQWAQRFKTPNPTPLHLSTAEH